MRVINFEEYCKSIQVPEQTEGKLTLKLTDSHCPWNEGIYRLDARNGNLEVREENDTQSAEFTLTPFQLSKVIGGLTPPSILQELGLITGSPETARTLEAIFPADSFLSYPRF